MSAIFIVDDEREVLSLLELGGSGGEAASGDAAAGSRERLGSRPPEAVLANVTAADLCRVLRSDARTRHVPVIVLGARGESSGGEPPGSGRGSDDGDAPLAGDDLARRVRAVLRGVAPAPRTPAAESAPVQVGPLAVDVEAHRARVAGEEIPLTPLEFRLLALLMWRVGRVQSREQLLQEVWKTSHPLETRTVDTHVKRLREKLGEARHLLETVRGVGYRLVAPAPDDRA